MKSDEVALKIIKGTTFLLVAEMIIFVFTFVTKIISARYLGPANLGVFALITMGISIFGSIFLFGIPGSMVKYLSEYKAKNKETGILFQTAFSFAVTAALVAFLLIFIMANYISIIILHNSNTAILVRISSISIIFTIIGNLLNNSFIGFQRIEYAALMNAANSFILASSLTLILYLGYGLTGAILCVLFASLFTMMIGFVLMRRIIRSWSFPFFDKTIFRELLDFSIPLFIASSVELILSWADSFLIGFFLNTTSVGYYSIVLTIMSLIGILNRPLNTSIYPAISEAYAKGDLHRLSLILNYSIKLDTYLALACSTGGAILAEPLIKILFGDEFLPGVTALRIIAFGAAFQSLRIIGTKYFAGIGKPNIGMNYIIISAALDLMLNIILIPIYGITGAAISTSISYFVMVLLSYKYIRSEIKISLDFIPKCIASSLFMALILFIALIIGVDSIFRLITAILVGALSYFISLYFMGGISKAELALIKSSILGLVGKIV